VLTITDTFHLFLRRPGMILLGLPVPGLRRSQTPLKRQNVFKTFCLLICPHSFKRRSRKFASTANVNRTFFGTIFVAMSNISMHASDMSTRRRHCSKNVS
jgi:hypothetical protein